MNIIYLSNIQYAKTSDNIKFVPYFNCQNHMKDKEKIFQIGHSVSYKYCRSVGVWCVSDTRHVIYEVCQSIIGYHESPLGWHSLTLPRFSLNLWGE